MGVSCIRYDWGMKRLLPFLLFCALVGLVGFDGHAQVLQPNLSQSCTGSCSVTATGTLADVSNLSQQAVAWRLTYWYTGFTQVIGQINCAPDNGSGAAGTYAACGGAFDGTTNPVTVNSSPQAGTIAVKVFSPHVAVNFTVTGTGNIRYLLVGYVGTNVSPSNLTASFTPSGTQDVNLVKVGGAAYALGAAATAASMPVNIASDQTVPVAQQGNAALLSGQQAVTGTAAALATHASKSVCVKALLANTINVYVGTTGVTTSTGFELTPGAGLCMALSNVNLVFVVASTTGASVSWASTN